MDFRLETEEDLFLKLDIFAEKSNIKINVWEQSVLVQKSIFSFFFKK